MSDFRQAFETFVEAYRDDPVSFAEEVLKATPLEWQKELLRAVARGERRISVRAGHGVGKSTVCSWLLLWHMLTRFPQKAVCLAGNVRVLTNRGWLPIVSVQLTDLLWDGVEWVRHEGLIYKGLQQTISLAGLRLTPRHEMLCGEMWVTAYQAAQDKNILFQLLATGSENLPSQATVSESAARYCKIGQFSSAVTAVRQSMARRKIILEAGKRLAAWSAAGAMLSQPAKRMSDTATSLLTILCEMSLSRGSMAYGGAATAQSMVPTTLTASAGSSAGGMSNTASEPSKRSIRPFGVEKCLDIWSRLKTGTNPASNLIGLTTTRVTSRGTSDLSAEERTPQTDELYGSYSSAYLSLKPRTQNCEPVYDLLNSGPRNRFTVLTDDGPVIVHNCTAPTAGQLFDALFAELKHWANRLPDTLREMLDVYTDRIAFKGAPESSFISARTSSAERPEALAGVHSENVLLICDEASAIPEPVFESAAGSMSGHTASTILISNPTRNSGLFFKSHHQLSSEWKTMHVSCVDNPLVNADFINQIASTYGEASNAYRVRVLGEFALRDDDSLIPAELVDAAMIRDIVSDPQEPIVYGIDVARFGDDRTVICKRQGSVVLGFKHWSGEDLMGTVGRIVHEASMDKPAEILVDTIGLGSGVADRLRELGHNVRDVNVSESVAMNQSAARLRDELWLAAKNWLETRAVKLPKDDDLRQELIGPSYTFTSNGRVKVEGKSEMKRRGMRSPDLADALCLTFASSAAMVGGRAPRWIPGKPILRRVSVC